MDIGSLIEVEKYMRELSLNTTHQATIVGYFVEACTSCRLASANIEAIYMARLALEHMGLDWKNFTQGHLVFKEEYTLDLALLSQLLYDLSIIVYYLDCPTDAEAQFFGRWICDLITLSPNIDDGIINTTRNNASFYYQKIAYEEKYQFDIQLPIINEDTDMHYNAMNPSIVPAKEGYVAIVRSVNYTQEFAVHFTSHDRDQRIRTKNFLVGLDDRLNTVWQAEIMDNSGLPKIAGAMVEGLEDMRLFWLTEPYGCPVAPHIENEKSYNIQQSENLDDIRLPDVKDNVMEDATDQQKEVTDNKILAKYYYGVDLGQLAFTCTTANTHASCVPHISVGRFSPYITEEGTVSVCQLQPLVSWKQPGNSNRMCEKNWLAFPLKPHEGLIIYSYQPLTMVKCPLIEKWQKLVKIGRFRVILTYTIDY